MALAVNLLPTGMPPGGRLTTTPSDVADPGETVLGSETAGGSVPALNWKVRVPAVLSCRSSKDAMPPCTVACFVPISVPEPLASDAVTTVLLSVVTTFSY